MNTIIRTSLARSLALSAAAVAARLSPLNTAIPCTDAKNCLRFGQAAVPVDDSEAGAKKMSQSGAGHNLGRVWGDGRAYHGARSQSRLEQCIM